MNVIDELCRMLDERGVKCHQRNVKCGRSVGWTDSNGYLASAEEWGGALLVQAILTPEQAVDSTVGRETYECEANEMAYDMLSRSYDAACEHIRYQQNSITDMHDELVREHEARMALQREYNNQCERIRNQRRNLTEMQAALERKTCRMTLCAAGNDYARYRCSECEQETMTPRVLVEGVSCGYERPTYCVNCGRKVV